MIRKQIIQESRILIVDDSAANLKLARVLLEREGYAVRTAADAESAIRVLSSLKSFLETGHPLDVFA